MSDVFLNRIATAVPRHQVHGAFSAFARAQAAPRDAIAFARMAARADIATRWSVLEPSAPEGSGTLCGFYRQGAAFPSTQARMRRYEAEAPALAEAALHGLRLSDEAGRITHVIVASCTGLMAPGLKTLYLAHHRMDFSTPESRARFLAKVEKRFGAF